MSTEPKPCPFCGGNHITVQEGSTFRWVHATCGNCGAQSGEVRRNTMVKPEASWLDARADAIEEWNKRAP